MIRRGAPLTEAERDEAARRAVLGPINNRALAGLGMRCIPAGGTVILAWSRPWPPESKFAKLLSVVWDAETPDKIRVTRVLVNGSAAGLDRGPLFPEVRLQQPVAVRQFHIEFQNTGDESQVVTAMMRLVPEDTP